MSQVVPDIIATIEPDIIHEIFDGKDIIHCIIELIKNALDWDAQSIRIRTDNRKQFMILDDGEGMGEANRNQFVSIGKPRSKILKGKRGKYATGIKQVLMSLSTSVTVVTVSKELPDTVVRFTLKTSECGKNAINKIALRPEALPKNDKTWPYDSETGTLIIFDLHPEKIKLFKDGRGNRLAQELALRLPSNLKYKISIDEIEELPDVDLIGKRFEFVEVHPRLGTVSIDIMRPKLKKSSPRRYVRVTGKDIGEGKIGTLVTACRNMDGYALDPIYLLPEVAGHISCAMFENHTTESRERIAGSIANEPLTLPFIRLLNRLAPAVRRDLGFEAPTDENSDDKEEFMKLMSKIKDFWDIDENDLPSNGKSKKKPVKPDDKTPGDNPDDVPSGMAIKLKHPREVEVGETFEITASIKKEIRDQGLIKHKDIDWNTKKSGCTDVQRTDTGIRMTAETMGPAYVVAEVVSTAFSDMAHYSVVNQRYFHTSPSDATITTAEVVQVTASNVDKLKGKLKWSKNGSGTMTIRNRSVIFTPATPGIVRITAYDSENPDHKSFCDIVVKEVRSTREVFGMVMDDETYFFRYDDIPMGGVLAECPIMMVEGGTINSILLNTKAPGYQEAKKANTLHNYIWRAICSEFARFVHFEFTVKRNDEAAAHMSPDQARQLMSDLEMKGNRIFHEHMHKLR